MRVAKMAKLFLTSHLLGHLSARGTFISRSIYFNVHLTKVEMCGLVWKDSLFKASVTELQLMQRTATIQGYPEAGLEGSNEPKMSQI